MLPNGLTVSYLASESPGGATVSAVATNTGVSITSTREIGSGPLLGLPSPVQAVGFDLSFTRGATGFGNFLIAFPTISASSSAGGRLSFPTGSGFFGFISDPGTSFNEVDVRCRAQDCIAIGGVDVNNISVSSAIKSVPESSSTLGLSAALGVFFALNLKSKQQKYL